MNKIKFLVFICFLTFTISCSQQKRYVSYKVKEGETMRDIANRFDIRTKDLLKLNPDVGRKPSENTTIIIPNPKLKKGDNVSNEETEQLSNQKDLLKEDIREDTAKLNDSIKVERIIYEYVTHTVEPKETVYALTKKYAISKEDLLKLNPEYPNLKNNELSIGQVLKVQVKEIKTYVSLEEDLKNYVTHIVKPKETVYGLTRFYNISKEDLVALNPEHPSIKENYLGIGQVLRIKSIEEKSEEDTVVFYHDTIVENSAIKLAVLLPFKAKEYSKSSSKEVFKNNPLTNMVTDFYMGLEIAVDSIKKQGVKVDVSVFDSGNRGDNIKNILNTNQLDAIDVVVGPFYSDKAEMVANKVKIPVVFPHFSNKQDAFKSNRLVKAEPDIENHTSFLSSYLKGIYKNETIFIVGDGKTDSDNQIKNLVSNLKKHDSIKEIIVLKPEDGYIEKTRFTEKMSTDSHNWVIMTSNDNVVVADALNSMIVLPEEVSVQVFSTKKNNAYNSVDNNKLARINFAYVSNSFSDKKSLETSVFEKKYKKKNYANPSEYAIKGFDVVYDVLIRLASGKTLQETFKEGASLRLESKFDFDKKLLGASTNKGLFLVQYNKDLSLKRLK